MQTEEALDKTYFNCLPSSCNGMYLQLSTALLYYSCSTLCSTTDGLDLYFCQGSSARMLSVLVHYIVLISSSSTCLPPLPIIQGRKAAPYGQSLLPDIHVASFLVLQWGLFRRKEDLNSLGITTWVSFSRVFSISAIGRY
jgi:hypothetical protein